MDAVALQHVEKSYTSYSSEIVITGQTRQSRTRQVLRDLSVRFPIGQLTVIVGRSGCGKSTLLKLLAGKEQPDAGQIDMPQGWHSALLSPDPYVITWTNVQRNVAMACGVGKTPEERYEKAADFVRLVGLQDYADLTPAELSTGMKQRLGLARVLASQAQLLLMDEPFASLDFLTRGELQSQLLAIQKKLPRTIVLVTHQFVTGAATCESEELSVGGADNVDASVFDVFDYVALGHIHSPQNIGSSRIRYCGTPLKYSFSEAGHHKSVTIVTLGKKGELSLRLSPLVPRRDLREIRGSFAEVTEKAYYERCSTEDYLHVILTDEEDIPEAVGRLRLIYPNLMKLSYDNTRTRSENIIDATADVQRKTPLELFGELYEAQNNQPMSGEQRAFAQELIESIWEERP